MIRIIYSFAFLFIIQTAYGQTKLKQLERAGNKYEIGVATETMIIGTDTSYYQKYMGLQELMDSLQMVMGSLDSLYIENDTIYLRDGTGYATLLDNDPSNERDTITINGQALTNGSSITIQSSSEYNDSILPYGQQSIGRTFSVGTNLQANTIKEWIAWHYQQNATAPSLTMNSIPPTLVEVGTTNNYTLAGSLNNPCNYTIGTRLVDGTSWTGTSYSKAVSYTPSTATTKSYSATAAWTNAGSTCAPGGASSGTASASRSVTSVYPVLWGMSATSYTGGNVPYNIWSRRLTTEGNQTGLTMNGTNMYIYILVPKSWSDFIVNTIIDHNGFNVTPSFTAYDVTVTGGPFGSFDYKLYKLNNLTTANGFNFVYNR